MKKSKFNLYFVILLGLNLLALPLSMIPSYAPPPVYSPGHMLPNDFIGSNSLGFIFFAEISILISIVGVAILTGIYAVKITGKKVFVLFALLPIIAVWMESLFAKRIEISWAPFVISFVSIKILEKVFNKISVQ